MAATAATRVGVQCGRLDRKWDPTLACAFCAVQRSAGLRSARRHTMSPFWSNEMAPVCLKRVALPGVKSARLTSPFTLEISICGR